MPRSLRILGGWDTNWYLSIAEHGYQHATFDVTKYHSDFVFFPLLPGIMRIGTVTSTNAFLWGFVASNMAFLIGLVAFNALTADRMNRAFADRATWVLAFSPAAVYASLAYTDGILLAVAACAALAATRGKWYLAGLLGIAGALARPQGILVAVLVVLIALWATDVPLGTRVRHAAIGAVPALLAFVGFFAWMQIARGSWLLPLRGQAAWYRAAPGWPAIRGLGHQFGHVVSYPFTVQHPTTRWMLYWTGPLRDVIFTLVMIGLFVALIRFERTWRSVWVVFVALVLLVPIESGAFTSEMRFGLLAFPLIWPITAWLERGGRLRRDGLLGLGVVLIVALTLQLHYAYP